MMKAGGNAEEVEGGGEGLLPCEACRGANLTKRSLFKSCNMSAYLILFRWLCSFGIVSKGENEKCEGLWSGVSNGLKEDLQQKITLIWGILNSFKLRQIYHKD